MTEIHVFDNDIHFRESVLDIRGEHEFSLPRVCRLGGGVLRFTRNVFPEQTEDVLFAKLFARDEGIGPHFDIYGDYIDSEFPWVGVYNLAGNATVTTAPLSQELTTAYYAMFPERTEEAGAARRHFGAIAFLGLKDEDITKFKLSPGIGMVIAQNGSKSELVHDVVPDQDTTDGRFIKIIKANKDNQKGIDELTKEHGYSTLEELIVTSMGGQVSALEEMSEKVEAKPLPRAAQRPLRRPHAFNPAYFDHRVD